MAGGEKQRVALVTGGVVRLGRAISRGLAEAGYDLVLGYLSSASEAETFAAEVTALGRQCRTVRADLAAPDGVDLLAGAARDAFDSLDLVVNSAASFRAVPLLDVDAAEWDAVMSLNVRAPHLMVRATADLLRASRGSVVNITDVAAFEGWTKYPHHSVAKAALAHLTRVQARALAPDVRVNAVAPGAVLPPDDLPEERWRALAERAVLKRVGSPDDVVQAVLYLAEATFVTGQTLVVDGGWLLGPTGPGQG